MYDDLELGFDFEEEDEYVEPKRKKKRKKKEKPKKKSKKRDKKSPKKSSGKKEGKGETLDLSNTTPKTYAPLGRGARDTVVPILDVDILFLRDLNTLMYPDELRKYQHQPTEVEDEISYSDVMSSITSLDEEVMSPNEEITEFDTGDFLKSMQDITLNSGDELTELTELDVGLELDLEVEDFTGLPNGEESFEELFDLDVSEVDSELPVEDMEIGEVGDLKKPKTVQSPLKMQQQGDLMNEPETFGESAAPKGATTRITYDKDHLKKISEEVH